LFGAIIVSLLSVEVFYFMKKKNLVIKMPEQVPPAVSDSFAALFPTIIVVSVSFIIFHVIGFNIHGFMNMIMSPFQSFLSGNNLFGALFTVFLITLLWSVGIHGVSIMGGILRPFWQIALEQNADAIASGVNPSDLPNIITEPFYQWFVWIGGSGATLGLIIAIMFIAKSAMLKEMAKLTFLPSIFNINEPVIFGIPIVLNPILMIPFIVGPLVITTISYFAISWNLVTAPYLLAPWTMPGPIGAFLATGDFWAIVLVLVNLLVVTIIYLPFVKAYDNQLLAEEQQS
jgi:PTS system cellobiose-specific IIC component